MIIHRHFANAFPIAVAGLFLTLPFSANAVQRDYFADQRPQIEASLTYVDLADLVIASSVMMKVKIKSATALSPERSPGIAPNHVRFFVTSDVEALLAGPRGVPYRVTYLVDLPRNAQGKPPRLKKQLALIFAKPVQGSASQMQLVAPDAQIEWSPDLELRARAIVQDKLSNSPPPQLTGIREALHVPGNLIGESETQIFLGTSTGEPVSLTVVRRPGMQPQWGVSFSEIVDQSASPPVKDTLAWYRLACSLPAQLPQTALIGSDTNTAQAAAQDYQLIRRELGECARTRPPIYSNS